MKESHKIMLVNTGSGRNLGDRAMAINVLRLLMENSFHNISVPRQFPENIKEELGLESYIPIHNCLGRITSNSSIIKKIDISISILILIIGSIVAKLKIKLPESISEFKAINSINSADCIIFNGGGYLTDKGRLEFRSCLLTGIIGKFLGKKVFLTGQGIGPVNTNISLKLLKVLTKRVDCILVRDPSDSANLLKSLGVDERKIFCAGDDALTLPLKDNQLINTDDNRKKLAVNFRISPFMPNSEKLKITIKETLDKRISEGWIINLFVFTSQSEWEKDVYQGLVKDWPKDSYSIIESDDPRTLKALIAKCDLSIGLAYHFLVFSLSESIPCIGLFNGPYYKQKNGGLFSLFGLPENSICYEGLTSSVLNENLSRVLKEKQDKKNSEYLKSKHTQLYKNIIKEIEK